MKRGDRRLSLTIRRCKNSKERKFTPTEEEELRRRERWWLSSINDDEEKSITV